MKTKISKLAIILATLAAMSTAIYSTTKSSAQAAASDSMEEIVLPDIYISE